MAIEIRAAEYFLPKGRASLYAPFGQASNPIGWMQPGVMSTHRPPGAWPLPVMGEDGLYIGFNDGISRGGWLSGPRTATMPYGGAGALGTGARFEGDAFNAGEGLGIGPGLSLPRGTPNPYTLGLSLSSNVGIGSSSGEYNHYPF